MMGFGSPFGGSEASFDEVGTFVADHVPDPGPFLEDHRVLTGEEHVSFHQTTRELFEERGVYDVTFDYNLAKLNLDRRHEDAGFRYAEAVETTDSDSGDDISESDAEPNRVLRAEFTPTTEFCPQTATLTKGAFRAWNGLADRHDYDLVRVRTAPLHHDSEAVNDTLRSLESEFLQSAAESGVPDPTDPAATPETPDPARSRPARDSSSDELPF